MSSENKKAVSTGSARFVNRLNKIRILDLVRTTENLSRADIAKSSGLSAPTVSRIVEALIREGLIREVGEGASQGGRRPTLLKFSEQGNFIVGLDLGTTHIYGVLCDFEGKIAAEIRRPTQVEQGFASVMKRTSEVIKELLEFPLGRDKRVYGIGLAVAGLINRSRNIVEFSPDFHWHNVDVVEALAPAHDLPIIFDNVTRVMALGEMWYGLGKRYRNLICVNVGFGIGAGIIVDGKPLLGLHGMAGEFGHVTLDKDSAVLCECGNRGCVEALASGNAIARTARARFGEAGPGLLRDYCGGDPEKLTTEMVANAAQRGDRLALEIFDTAIEYLGVGIAGLINVFNPEAVVIGGGVAQAGDILFDKVRRTVNSRALNKIASGVVIRPATFGIRAAVMGAVSLVLSDVLSLSRGN